MAKDGMFYAPKSVTKEVVCGPGEFTIAAVALDHGHIYGMVGGLLDAGATLKWVYDPDPKKVEAFQKQFPQAQAAGSEAEVLADDEVLLVASAAITSDRAPLGMRVLAAGKDYFTDKAPFTTLEQLKLAREEVKRTGKSTWCITVNDCMWKVRSTQVSSLNKGQSAK